MPGVARCRAEPERRGILHSRRAVASAGDAPGSERLSHADRRNLQRLSVLRDGAARDNDTLLAEDLRYLAVREGSFAVFRGDQLLDQRPDRGRGARAAGFRRNVASEEILELEYPARSEHEF